jgi:hypothetical protein
MLTLLAVRFILAGRPGMSDSVSDIFTPLLNSLISVTNYANPESLASKLKSSVGNFSILTNVVAISWTIPFTAVATSIAAILTQGFLAHR